MELSDSLDAGNLHISCFSFKSQPIVELHFHDFASRVHYHPLESCSQLELIDAHADEHDAQTDFLMDTVDRIRQQPNHSCEIRSKTYECIG